MSVIHCLKPSGTGLTISTPVFECSFGTDHTQFFRSHSCHCDKRASLMRHPKIVHRTNIFLAYSDINLISGSTKIAFQSCPNSASSRTRSRLPAAWPTSVMRKSFSASQVAYWRTRQKRSASFVSENTYAAITGALRLIRSKQSSHS